MTSRVMSFCFESIRDYLTVLGYGKCSQGEGWQIVYYFQQCTFSAITSWMYAWMTSAASLKPRVRHFPCRICAGLHHHNSPGDWARELFKPSEEAERLAVSMFKNLGSFRFLFFMGYWRRFSFFGWRHRVLGAKAKSQFLTQICSGN